MIWCQRSSDNIELHRGLNIIWDSKEFIFFWASYRTRWKFYIRFRNKKGMHHIVRDFDRWTLDDEIHQAARTRCAGDKVYG